MADKTINDLTAIDAVAVGDLVAVWDISGTPTTKKATGTQLKAAMTDVDIIGLTSATPVTGDSMVIYDLDATANRKVLISDILGLGLAQKLVMNFSPFGAALPSVNFPELLMVNARPVLAYDAATDELCDWAFLLPSGLGSGTVTISIYYIMASATSGNVKWNVNVEAVSSGDATDLDATTSFDTSNTSTVTVAATAGYLSTCTFTMTNKDGWIGGTDYVRVRLTRDANDAGDTAAGDAYLLGFMLQES
jgi:hypothetical protein